MTWFFKNWIKQLLLKTLKFIPGLISGSLIKAYYVNEMALFWCWLEAIRGSFEDV